MESLVRWSVQILNHVLVYLERGILRKSEHLVPNSASDSAPNALDSAPDSVRLKKPLSKYTKQRLVVCVGSEQVWRFAGWKNDGVFVGQNVIGIKGLIGQVIETTFVSSKVILINDTSHNVPGEINRTGEKVIVSGTKDKNKLEIDFLDVNTDIRVGDIVSTSGLGERFKAKIPIGKVTFVEQDPEREFSEIEIKSFENLENLTDLILIWDYKPNMNTNKKSDNNENNGSKDNE